MGKTDINRHKEVVTARTGVNTTNKHLPQSSRGCPSSPRALIPIGFILGKLPGKLE